MSQEFLTNAAVAAAVVILIVANAPLIASIIGRVAASIPGLRQPSSTAAPPDLLSEQQVFADLAAVSHALVLAGNPPDVVKKLIDPLTQMVIDYKKGASKT